MERIIDRFDKYMMYKGLNDNRVTVATGISTGVIGKSRKEGRDMSRGLILTILKYFSDLSYEWLTMGKGNMLITPDSEIKEVVSEVKVSGKSVLEIEKENEFLKQTIALKDEIRKQDLELMEFLKTKANGDQKIIDMLNERIKQLESEK